MNNLSAAQAIEERFAARRFTAESVSEATITQLIELADRAPSGFNLQPWRFVLVRDPKLKRELQLAAMNQPQVGDSAGVVVFVADPNAGGARYNEVLALAKRETEMNDKQAAFYRKNVSLLFLVGPLGLVGFFKRLAIKLGQSFRPLPGLVYSRKDARNYVRAQTMLSVATFMIAAKGMGIDTSPMEGFDEQRVKKLLKIPARMTVPVLVAYGISAREIPDQPRKRSVRLPLAEKLYLETFSTRPEIR